MSDGQIKIKAQVEGLAEAANQIDNFSKRSVTALTSLNQVVQDLPFGFIGIQNNIPNLVQQFSLLTKESGGFKNALISLGNAVSGPIGLVAGISLLTTALTALVQKYGSLTTAFKDIFGVQKTVVDLQRQYNEELSKSIGASEAEKVNLQSLAKIYLDINSTLNQRVGSYDLLKKSYSELLPDIARETKLTEEQSIAVKERLKLLLQEIGLKGQQQALQNLIAKNSEEYFKLNSNLKDGIDLFEGLGFIVKSFFQGNQNAVQTIGNEFSKLNQESKFYSSELDVINLKLSEVTKIINDATIAEKKRLQAIKDAKKLSDEKIKIEKKLADELLKAQQDRFNKEDAAFKILKDAYISTLTEREKELYKIQDEYEQKRGDLLRANISDFSLIEEEKLTAIRKVVEKYDKIALDQIKKQNDAELKLAKEQAKQVEDLFKNDTFNYQPKINIDYSKLGFSQGILDQLNKGNTIGEAIKNIENQTLSVGKSIYSNIINPLNELFDIVLTKGQKSWETFTKSVVELLKKLLVKLAAAAALAAILSAVSGGAVAGGVSFGKVFGSLLGVNLGGGGIANPGFGGVNPGGMAMAGSVNLVLRGQDLVGSINRTNSQISRVG